MQNKEIETDRISKKLIIATSTRRDGPMGFLDLVGGGVARENRKKFLSRFGAKPDNLIRVHQVHGTKVVKVTRKQSSQRIPKGDALITDHSNLFLSVLSADCFPIFFYDSKLSVVGIAHAGWRGIMRGVVTHTVGALRRYFKIDSKDLKVIIGPGIRKCHFEVWPQGRHKGISVYLRKYHKFVFRKKDRTFVDLDCILREQLIKAGIKPGNIRSVKECTYHLSKKYFSYRRDARIEHPRGYGNMLSVIGILYGKEN